MDGSGERKELEYVDKPLKFRKILGFRRPTDRYMANLLKSIFDNGGYVAGGFARRAFFDGIDAESGDMDIYPKTDEDFKKLNTLIAGYKREGYAGYVYTRHVKGARGIFGFNGCLQVIDRSVTLEGPGPGHQQPRDLLNNFDFTVCKFYIDNFRCYAREDALRDYKTKTLRVSSDTEQSILCYRLKKYLDKGFKIDKKYASEFAIKMHDIHNIGILNLEEDIKIVFDLFSALGDKT